MQAVYLGGDSRKHSEAKKGGREGKRWEERVKRKEKKVSKVCVIESVITVGN